MIKNQLGKLFDDYVDGTTTYPEKTKEFQLMKKPGAQRKIKLTLGTQLEKPEVQGSLLLSEMDFVAVRTKRTQNIEIVGSNYLFHNPKLVVLDEIPEEIIAIDELCSCEPSEHSEELPKITTPQEVPFMKKRVQLQAFPNQRQTKQDTFNQSR